MRDLTRVRELTDEYLSVTHTLEDPMNLGPRNKPRASTLVSCARNQWYAMTDTPKTNLPNPSQRITQEEGRLAEDISVKVIEALDIEVNGRQDEITDSFITGHPDGTMYFKVEDDGTVGFEHKKFSSYKYLKVCQYGVEVGAPDVLAQAVLYGWHFGWHDARFYLMAQAEADVRREIARRIEWATTSKKAETRDRWRVFREFEFNPKIYVEEIDLTKYYPLIPNLRKRAEDLTRLAAGGIIPVREADPSANKFPCTWCDWRDRCPTDPQGNTITPVPNVFKE